MTQNTWKLANLETHIQQLLESVGLTSLGQATLRKTKLSRKHLTTDITLTVSCVRSWATVATTSDNPKPSQPKPDFPKPSLETSNPNILELSRHISNTTGGLILSFEQLETLQRLLDGKDGSLDVEMIHLHSARPLRMILRVL